MSLSRSIFVLVGIATATAGIAAAFMPGLIDLENLTYVIVTVLGVVALVQAVSTIFDRINSQDEAAKTPTVERPESMTIPGADFDEGFGELGAMGRMRGARHRDAVRDRLETATVAVLTRYNGLTEETAREQMRAGTWTDDVYAAAFFAADVDDNGLFGGFLRTSLMTESVFQQRARHVIDALNRRLITEER